MSRRLPVFIARALTVVALAAPALAAAPAATLAAPAAAAPASGASQAAGSAAEPVATTRFRRPGATALRSPSRRVPTAPAPAVPAPVQTAGTSQATSFQFLSLDAGKPVRWNPCGQVPWTFNPAGAPAGGLATVQAAMDEIARRTGLNLHYLGTSTATPDNSYLQQTWGAFQPLLVGWSTPARSDLLAGAGEGTVGMARVLWTGSYDQSGANRTQVASAVVAFNAEAKAGSSWYAFALHELGHAIGLGHVDDASQIMNPVIDSKATGYGAGDLAGLTQLGSAAGCLPSIR